MSFECYDFKNRKDARVNIVKQEEMWIRIHNSMRRTILVKN